jgi:large subunit ribosomal protein L28
MRRMGATVNDQKLSAGGVLRKRYPIAITTRPIPINHQLSRSKGRRGLSGFFFVILNSYLKKNDTNDNMVSPTCQGKSSLERINTLMARTCSICGKAPVFGQVIARRGKAKKRGGAGRNITGTAHRTFLPNLRSIRAIVDGAPTRLRICTKCLKSRKIQKAA